MKNKFSKVVVVFLCFLFTINIVYSAVQTITTCTILDVPNTTYILTTDILNSGNVICFYIIADNVTLDCSGHIVDGSNKAGTYGIQVESNNVTVKNCTLTDWDAGVYFKGGTYGNILNVEAFNNVHNILINSSSHIHISDFNSRGLLNIIVANSSNISIESGKVDTSLFGIFFNNSRNLFIYNVTIYSVSQASYGIYGKYSSYVFINSSIVYGLQNGIYFISVNNSTIYLSRIYSNSNGIVLSNSSNLLIYNNYFNNSNNISITTSYASWNSTSLVMRPNIVNGLYIAGNYWGKPSGTGFSDTCTDANNDTLCDSPFHIDQNNVDYYPLTKDKTPPFVSSSIKNSSFIFYPVRISVTFSDNAYLKKCYYILEDDLGRSYQESINCYLLHIFIKDIYLNPSINEVCYSNVCYLKVFAEDLSNNSILKVFTFFPIKKELNLDLGIRGNIIRIKLGDNLEGIGSVRNAGTLNIYNLSIKYRWICNGYIANITFNNFPKIINSSEIKYFYYKITSYKIGRCKLLIVINGQTSAGNITAEKEYTVEAYCLTHYNIMLIPENLLPFIFLALLLLIWKM